MRTVPFRAVLLWAVALAIPAGAQSGADRVVARIGATTLTIEGFEARARSLRQQGYQHLQTMDAAAKAELLNGIVSQELLVLEGERRDLDDDPAIAADLATRQRRAVMQALYDTRALTGDYGSTEQEQRAYYHEQQLDVAVLSRHIICLTEHTAHTVIAALASGTPFDSLVAKYTAPEALARFGPRGAIGWVRVGDLYETLRQPLTTMAVGSVLPEPVETNHGYHVVLLDGRRRAPFEASAGTVRERLRVQKRADAMAAYIADLRTRYDIRIDPEGLRVLSRVGEPNAPVTEQTVVSWDGGRLTVADYMELVGQGRAPHPAAEDSASLAKQVDNQVGVQVMMAEARRLGLDRDPAVRAQVEARRRQLFAQELYRQEAGPRTAQIDTSAANVSRFYEKNLDLYTRDGQVAPLATVAANIRASMLRVAEMKAMDAFIAELRERYADQIEVDEEALNSAFASPGTAAPAAP